MLDDRTFLERLRGTAAGQQILAAAAEEGHTARVRIRAELDAADAALTAALPALDQAIADAQVKAGKAIRAATEAEARVVEAVTARTTAIATRDRTIHRAEVALRETADPAVRETVWSLRRRAEAVRLRGSHGVTGDAVRSARSVAMRLDELSREAEALELSADPNVAERLADLRRQADEVGG